MARITRFLSLRKQFILNRSNVRYATIQIPDPTKIIESTNENSTNQNAGKVFPSNIDSFISWSKSSKSTKQNYGFLKANKRRNQNKKFEIAFHEARPGAGKDRFLSSTSWENFTKIIEDFKPNNYSTLSPANRRKALDLSFIKPSPVLNKIIYLDPKWDAATGEKTFYNRAKDQIDFLGKQKKPYYDGIVSALKYVALYEPEKLILEEYEIARTLFDNDSKFNRPTALQYVVIDQLLNTSEPICIQFAFQLASDITKKCSESGQKKNNIDEDFNIVLRILQHYFNNQNTLSPELRKMAEELSESPLIMDYQFEILQKSFSNEIDSSTMLNLDNYSQSKIIHYLHLQNKHDDIESFMSSIDYSLESFSVNSNFSSILTAIMPHLSVQTVQSLISSNEFHEPFLELFQNEKSISKTPQIFLSALSNKRPETDNIEILDALNIDNLSKLIQISPFLGDMDLEKSDDVTGSKVQLLLKIMELSERRDNILKSLKNNEKIDLHPIEILYEILSLKPPKNLFEKINKLGNADCEYPKTNSFQQKLATRITENISSFPNNFSKSNNGLVSLIQDFLINQSRSNSFMFRKLVSDPVLVPFLFRPEQEIGRLERFMTPENHSILTNSIPLLKNVLAEYNEPKLSEIKTELDLRHPLDLFTKNLLKSINFIENSDDFILCGDENSDPLIFRENLHLVLKSLPKFQNSESRDSRDGLNKLIDKEIGHLVDEEISLAENCNFYTYRDIPKNISVLWSSKNSDLIEKHLSNREAFPRYTLRSLLKKPQAQNYPHLQSLQPSIASCVTKLRSKSTNEQLDGLADLFCFYRPNMQKILENNKENMATLGRNIAKGSYDEVKCEAAIPAIHPGFRLQTVRNIICRQSIGRSMSQIQKWFPPAEKNEFTSKHLWPVFLTDQSKAADDVNQSEAQKISQINYLKNAKIALKEVYGIREEFFEISSFKWAASPNSQSEDDYSEKIEILRLVGIEAENAPIAFDSPLAETFRMQSRDVIMDRDDKIQLLFSAIANYQGDEFVKKCQIDDLNEPFTMQNHFRIMINRKRQMKPYQLHLIFDFLISLLPPGEDVSPIANVVFEYHQNNENKLDINLVLDFIKTISSRGAIIPGDALDFYKLLFIKKNIIDENIDPVYAEISSSIQNRNYQKGFEILANEYESRHIDKRMNFIVNKVLTRMQNQESIGELSECLEFIRGAFPSFGLQFKTVFGLISLFKRYRMGDEIEKLLKHENIPLLDENQVTNAEYMDILHRSRGQFYAEIEQLAKLQADKYKNNSSKLSESYQSISEIIEKAEFDHNKKSLLKPLLDHMK